MLEEIRAIYEPTLEHSKGLPSDAYLSDKAFVAETKHLFHKTWLCIGRVDDVPNNGDIKPLKYAGLPLLIVRDREFNVRVFHNSCPHRGALLADKPTNCRGNIVCPYHAWTFSLTGDAVRLPHVGGAGIHNYEGVDPTEIGLSQIRTADWYGLLFVNISGDAVEFDEFIAPIQKRIGNLDPECVRYDDTLSAEMSFNANWKLLVENFVESYHLPSVHPEFHEVNPMRDHYQVLGGYSYLGQGSTNLTVGGEGDDEYSGLPLREGLKDTADTYEAYYIYPNLLFTPVANYGFIVIIDPQSPSLTSERLEFIFYGDEAMSEKYKDIRKNNADFTILVNSQDVAICESTQIGRSSLAYTGGIFALPQETTSFNFIKLVAAKMLETDEVKAEDLVELTTENIHHPGEN